MMAVSGSLRNKSGSFVEMNLKPAIQGEVNKKEKKYCIVINVCGI